MAAKQKVIMCKGLPASGKSTFAKQLSEAPQWKRVSKDDLRFMLDNNRWSKRNEELVVSLRDHIIITALAQGYNVVIDDTNLQPPHEPRFRQIIAEHNRAHPERPVDFEVKFFPIDVEEAIKRDLLRPVSVGERVIRRMYRDFLAPKPDPVVVAEAAAYVEGLPDAIIVDMDGTLAKMNGRSPYDFARVLEDSLNEPVADVVRGFKLRHPDGAVIIVSGRDDSCANLTSHWLDSKYMPYDHLYMRRTGDKRKDSEVKSEIYEAHIKGKFNVRFVLDDRNQVVDYWRSVGLTCLQVAPGDF